MQAAPPQQPPQPLQEPLPLPLPSLPSGSYLRRTSGNGCDAHSVDARTQASGTGGCLGPSIHFPLSAPHSVHRHPAMGGGVPWLNVTPEEEERPRWHHPGATRPQGSYAEEEERGEHWLDRWFPDPEAEAVEEQPAAGPPPAAPRSEDILDMEASLGLPPPPPPPLPPPPRKVRTELTSRSGTI